MAATVGELLEQAQRAAWDLARARADLQPGSPMVRARQTWPTLRAHLAAWPALARAGQSTLGVIAVWPTTSWRRTPLQRTLERWSDQTPSRDLRSPARPDLGQEPDPGVDRITHLVAAVGDILTAARPTRDEEDLTRVESKILAVLETTARATLTHLDQTGLSTNIGTILARQLLHQMVDHTHEALLRPPGQRDGSYDDLAVYQPGETSLGATITRWGAEARRMLADSRTGSSGAQRVAADAALLLGGARTVLAAADLYALASRLPAGSATTTQTAQRAWSEAARSWPPHLGVPGATDRDFLHASHELGRQIHEELRPEGQWRLPNGVESMPTLAPVMRQALDTVEQVGRQYLTTTVQWTTGNRLATPARRLDRRELQERPELAQAQAAGRWVTLGPDTRHATALVEAATTAHAATQAAATAARPGSRAAQHPFGTPIPQPATPGTTRHHRRATGPTATGTGPER